ncbi:uncharacterized protein LOC144137897 [Haemaphysalis longicornis]
MRSQCLAVTAVISLFVVHSYASVTALRNGTSWDALDSTTYEDAVRMAQCEARCLEKFMEPSTGEVEMDDLSDEYLEPPKCKKEPCRQCFGGCHVAFKLNETCEIACTTEQCKSGCLFFNETSEERKTTEAGNVTWSLSVPEIVCYSLDGAGIHSLTLKWQLTEDDPASLRMNSTRRRVRHALPVLFVTQMRTRVMAAQDPHSWITLGTRYHGLIPVKGLKDGQHQFRVTAVLSSGPQGQARTSSWSFYSRNTTLSSKPVNVSVSKSTPDGHSVISRLTWSADDQYPSCNYALDLLPDRPDVASAHFRLSEAYEVFHYDMRGLSFDTNYTVILRSTDSVEKETGNPATMWFKTPSCLDCYQFNFSLCAPGPPSTLKVHEVSRPASTWVAPPARGVQIAWSPPAYTSEENRVLGYQVILEEEKSVFDLDTKPAPRIRRSVGADTEQVSVTDIRNGARYRVLVQAQSLAGLGQPAVTEYRTHKSGILNSVLLWTAGTCAVLVLVLAATATCYAVQARHKRRERFGWESGETTGSLNFGSSFEFGQLRKHAFRLIRKPSDPFEIHYAELDVQESIGRGAFGVVHRAQIWIGKVQETVAVKTLRDGATPEERRNLLREIELLKLVGQHPNVVSLRGYCTTGRTVALVVEYCPLGDLRAYLVRTRYAQLGRETHGSEVTGSGSPTSIDSGLPEDFGYPPSLPHLLSLTRQVAQGMEFLSSKRVVHRDLAARNVLMMNEQLVKIADLGLSRDMYQEGVYRKQGAERLPIRWMAPESLSHMTYTTMSDVWSFGVLMWETLSLGAVPYPGIQNHQLLEYIAAGNRLDKPSNCSMEAYDIMSSCWNPSPICRPTFVEIVHKLDGILEQSQEYFNFSTESE